MAGHTPIYIHGIDFSLSSRRPRRRLRLRQADWIVLVKSRATIARETELAHFANTKLPSWNLLRAIAENPNPSCMNDLFASAWIVHCIKPYQAALLPRVSPGIVVRRPICKGPRQAGSSALSHHFRRSHRTAQVVRRTAWDCA